MLAEETIDRVRREARIVAIIGERVKLTQRGRSHTGLCPFHKEKTPSFHVNEERGFYHCFGCAASGDAIKFLREVDGLSFIDAVRYIAERQGIDIVETGSDQERREHAEARKRRDELYDAGAVAAAFFEAQLESSPLGHLAVEELARRGLGTPKAEGVMGEALRAFRIGYAPYGWDGLARHLRATSGSVRAAEAVGLLVPRKQGPGHYDRFRHRLMFAIVDLDGRVVGFSGRALAEPSDADLASARMERLGGSGEPPAKYLNSPESPVYKKREAVFGLYQARSAVRREDRAILVEGNFDVVSLHARGIQNVVAPLGTAFTVEQAKQIRRYSGNVTLLFDGDSAGRRATGAAREPCREAGLVASVSVLPEGKDPDDLCRTGGPEAIANLLKPARSLLEHLVDEVLSRSFSPSDPVAVRIALAEVNKLIESEDDTVKRMVKRQTDRVFARLNLSAEEAQATGLASSLDARAGAHLGQSAARQASAAPPERARSRERRIDIALAILGALLDFPELIESPEVAETLLVIDGDPALAIAALRQDPTLPLSPEHLLAKTPLSIHPFAAARLAAPRHQAVDDAKAELLGNVEKLKRLELLRHKSEVVEELAKMQATGDFDREIALLGEQSRRARERHRL
jgi:DNA primase